MTYIDPQKVKGKKHYLRVFVSMRLYVNNDLILHPIKGTSMFFPIPGIRRDYTLALRDADFAFEYNYPPEMQHKLFERIGRCHLALGDPDKARQTFLKYNYHLFIKYFIKNTFATYFTQRQFR
jgi:hypothetical protein